ncbi:MAG: hypothetical protein NTV87_02230 [Ignavibacteriae bacterium]|jgi:hypothetical protein|nr:hypothetical protein [Ignavibacteriota bacterium]
MKKLFIIAFAVMLIAGCSKMEEKKSVPETNKNTTQMENPHTKGNMPGGDQTMKDGTENMDAQTESGKDPKAKEISDAAWELDKKSGNNPDEAKKKELISKHMAAGNYLMFEANVPPKEKYKPALKHFNRVIKLDASNVEALRNKKQIEEIYTMMGKPIPTD